MLDVACTQVVVMMVESSKVVVRLRVVSSSSVVENMCPRSKGSQKVVITSVCGVLCSCNRVGRGCMR